MGLRSIPVDTSGLGRAGQHGLTVGQAAQGGGIECAETVEGVFFVPCPFHRRFDETQIKKRVVSDEDGACAAMPLYFFLDGREDAVQCFLFRFGHAKGVEWVYTGKFQSPLFQIGAGEGLHMAAEALVAMELSLEVHAHGDCGNFQEGVGFGVESGGFHVDHNGEKTAKSVCDLVLA